MSNNTVVTNVIEQSLLTIPIYILAPNNEKW